MANTCISEFKITGSKSSISKLKSLINKTQKDTKDNGGFWFLFNILKELNIENDRQVDTRATASNLDVSYCLNDKYMLNFITESAWVEPYELFCLINDKLGLNLTINYIAEEPMAGHYVVVDKDNVFPKGYKLFD